MNVPSEIKNLFKSLASAHPSILHEDAEGKMAFAIDKISDIIDGIFKTEIKPDGFSLRYVKPIFNGFTDEANGMDTNVQAGFSILKKCDHTNIDEIETAQDEAFVIVKDVIARLIFESRKRNLLLNNSLNQLGNGQFTIEEVTFQGDGTFAGQLCLFQFKTEFIEDIDETVSATNWTDL
jgi:hypothetical protein